MRVMSHTGDYTRVVSRGAVAEPAVVGSRRMPARPSRASASTTRMRPVDHRRRAAPARLARHAPRRRAIRIRPGVEIQLDGNPAIVVDLSVMGAQVISATILRPNQRVRISVPTDDFVMRFRGAVAWAKFELPKPTEPPRYRAGVEFTDADAAAMDEYCVQVQAVDVRVARSPDRQRRGCEHALADDRVLAPRSGRDDRRRHAR